MMTQEHFYALYVFTVQSSNGGVATTPSPYLSTLKTYLTPGERPIQPVLHQNDRKGCPGSC